ncbi:hypothetical protein HPULCUR_009432 [Helicostylum pulchrum]|uniref:Uncharacterized protein n=1 Tax=Helicostylum pulchrum TaxID=562976 RepID=A0ABP9YCC8_9FUNG
MAPINKESPINNDAFQYVVGIDFGTTYSGAGYMFIKNAERKEVIDIKNWPKNRGSPNFKIPTVIRYHKKDRSIYKCGLEATSISKKEIDEYDSCIRLFKLHLSKKARADLTELPRGLDIVTVISDYLKYLHKHICSDIQKALGSSSANFEKKIESFRYCLTVPAIWTDDAKSKMREACILAGIIDRSDHVDRLLMVGEPEAAALYSEQMKGGISIKSGERLMIVDAGGGTIDLITFEKTINGETKSFKEIVDGDGNSSGSSQLDKRFREFVNRNTFSFSLDTTSLDQLVETFRTSTKIEIDHETPDDPVYINLPNSLRGRTIEKDNGFKMDIETLSIPTNLLLTEVFDPVIEEIIHLIEFQLGALGDKLLHYIILVGGFGQNTYLLQRIKDAYDNEEKVGDIIVPDVRELAVARGAVYFGLNPYSISHRRMRVSYGISISSPFIDDIDNPEYKIFDSHGDAYCKNRFDRLVSKGEDVSIKDCISREYKTQNSETFSIKLYSYSGDVTPRYVSVSDEDAEGTANIVADFVVPLPLSHGQDTSFKMDMYFGHMEIKIKITLDGSEDKRTFTASY